MTPLGKQVLTHSQTSFFSRYTKDIVNFADKYAGGKVVSVLEGGYSDRALTSAAMGHVIGMLDQRGEDTWWSEPELVTVRRTTFSVVSPVANYPALDRESYKEETNRTYSPHSPRSHITTPLDPYSCLTWTFRNLRYTRRRTACVSHEHSSARICSNDIT